jgi:hypothetical protein
MNPLYKLYQLKLEYEEALNGPDRNIDQARRIRDKIIMLEIELGM